MITLSCHIIQKSPVCTPKSYSTHFIIQYLSSDGISRICKAKPQKMASASASSVPLSFAVQNRLNQPSSEAFFKPLPKRSLLTRPVSKSSKLAIHASLKEKAVTGLTAASLTASMVIPEVAHAAGSDLSPSLKNFLLSIFAGGVVLAAIFGAVIGVSNFDPVKRT